MAAKDSGFKGREKKRAKETTEAESLSAGSPAAAASETADRGKAGDTETEDFAVCTVGVEFDTPVFFLNISAVILCEGIFFIIQYSQTYEVQVRG
jgi:hypothetical protein